MSTAVQVGSNARGLTEFDDIQRDDASLILNQLRELRDYDYEDFEALKNALDSLIK